MQVESRASNPAIASSRIARSSALFASGPPWSSDEAKATIPYRDTRPYVGRNPLTPVNDAGWRIDPPVSVPVAAGASAAAIAAADPPELPPGTVSVFHGLRTGPKCEVSFDEPIANSSMLVLPRITAP